MIIFTMVAEVAAAIPSDMPESERKKFEQEEHGWNRNSTYGHED